MTNPSGADAADERRARVARALIVPAFIGAQASSTATLTERMEFYRVPGVSLAVINDYQVEWAHAEGVVEAGGTHAVTTRALFQAGSLGKPVVALAALRLVEQGILSLDADVNTFLTSWKIPPNNAWQPRVTLRHLLTHTSGLTVPVYPGYPRNDALPSLLQVLEGKKPARTPAVRVDLTQPSIRRRERRRYRGTAHTP